MYFCDTADVWRPPTSYGVHPLLFLGLHSCRSDSSYGTAVSSGNNEFKLLVMTQIFILAGALLCLP